MGLIIFILNVIKIGNKCSRNNDIIFHSIFSFLPWLFVYGLIILIFRNFPGWKAPFSNTFGYLFVKLLSANTVIINLFNTLIFDKNQINSDNVNLSYLEKKTLLNNIYKDQSVMLNVITIENINKFWNDLFSTVPSAQDYREKLYNIIQVKDKVSEFIWYILLSTIAYSISNRYISTIQCNQSTKDLEKQAVAIDNLDIS